MLSIIIQLFLAFMFLKAGLPKFGSKAAEGFTYLGYPQWFRFFTAIVEVLAAVILIIGIWNLQFAAIGGFLVLATMIGAILTHIKMKDKIKNIMLPIILFVLGGIVFGLNVSALFG